MPNVGTISGSMYLDPSGYITGLNQAAQSTKMFQAGVERVSFAGFHRGIFATTTLLYGLNRIMSSMSQGMEEYTNMLGRIGSVADMTAASVEALADSMKKLSVAQGVSRTDIMGGMYTAAQSGFDSPAEMRAMATSGAKLSRASGKEIDVRKSVDLMSVARQALGIGQGAITSNRMTDLLLRGRDVGRWELDEMAQALGIPLTVYGNQFSSKIGGEETLRQLVTIMSTATLAGVNPRMAATGTRRLVERTVQLNKTKLGDPLRQALRGVGFSGNDPINAALDQGPMSYLNTLLKVSGNGSTGELTRLGYGSRDLMVLTSALRGKGQTLNDLYGQLSYDGAAGTTERYNAKMMQTYDAKRDQLRSQWEITSQEFMQASIPLIGQFTSALGMFNEAAQALPSSAKSLLMLVTALASARLALNFAGFRSTRIEPKGVLGGALGGAAGLLGGAASGGSGAGMRLLRLGNGNAFYPLGLSTSGGTGPVLRMSSSYTPSSVGSTVGASSTYKLDGGKPFYPITPSSFGTTRGKMSLYKQDDGRYFYPIPPSSGNIGSYTPSSVGTTRGAYSLYRQDDGKYLYPLGKPMTKSAFSGPSYASQLGTYMGARNTFEANGITAKSAMYSAMGVGGLMQAVGAASTHLSRFGSAIGSVLGPLVRFGVVIAAANEIVGALTYRGSSSVKEGGVERMRPEGLSYNALTAPLKSLGFLTMGLFNKDNLGDYTEEFARKNGLVADADGKGMSSFEAWKRTGQTALAGYRDVTMNDVMGIVSREGLGAGDVRKFQKGGIDFGNFETARPYVDEYLDKQLGGKKAPDNWEQWVRGTDNGINQAADLIVSALKFAAEKINSATKALVAEPRWNAPFRADVPEYITEALTRNSIIGRKQWDIYSGSDYLTSKNGNLNWDAGGQDYRQMYKDAVTQLDTSYGGFTKTNYAQAARGAIGKYDAAWREKAKRGGAIWEGVEMPPETQFMLDKGDRFFKKNQNLRSFLDVMPNIGSMDVAEQAKWFERMTGRTPGSDVFSKANFDNFRNMNVADYVETKQIGLPTKYESATQFGTAEAYNQLLPSGSLEEKIVIAVEKLQQYFESMSTNQEDVMAELSKMAKQANKFYEQAESSAFFTNISEIADNTGDL